MLQWIIAELVYGINLLLLLEYLLSETDEIRLHDSDISQSTPNVHLAGTAIYRNSS